MASLVKNFIEGNSSQAAAERRLVQKLDFFIMTYCCLSFFFNFLDRAAFANAFVTGMREALHMSGQDYSVILAITTIGMAVGQIPHGIIIQKISPRIWFPSMVVISAGFTMVTAVVKTTSQLCAVRFLLGLCEASTYAGTLYIIGAWYKPDEIAKRTALFTASGQIGTMFAGVMMTTIQQGMDGTANLAGWQWVWLIDGIITLPIAIFGFLYFPDTPSTTKARYLSAEEIAIAKARVIPVKPGGYSVNPRSLLKRLVLNPLFWILFFWSPVCAAIEAFPFQNNFLLWLKYYKNEKNFSQGQINTYPIGVQAVGIIAEISAAWYIDMTGQKVSMAMLACLLQIIVAVILIIPSLPTGADFFAYYLSGTSYMVNPLIFGWANIILQRTGDAAVRGITLYSMNIGSQVLWTFWGILFYNGDDAPYWKNGCIVLMVCCVIMLGYLVIMKKVDSHTIQRYLTDPTGETGVVGADEADKEKQERHTSSRSQEN